MSVLKTYKINDKKKQQQQQHNYYGPTNGDFDALNETHCGRHLISGFPTKYYQQHTNEIFMLQYQVILYKAGNPFQNIILFR